MHDEAGIDATAQEGAQWYIGNKAALFPYTQPALFAMPIAFLLAYIMSKSDSSVRAGREIEAFEDQYVRAQTGYGAATASNH